MDEIFGVTTAKCRVIRGEQDGSIDDDCAPHDDLVHRGARLVLRLGRVTIKPGPKCVVLAPRLSNT